MSDQRDEKLSEFLIIKRRGFAELEPPKTGVWKIAYADFMTALMAFFLVMWLINATDEATRADIANYFNPINLSDAPAPRKGVRDPEEIDPGQSASIKPDPAPLEGSSEQKSEAHDAAASGEKPEYGEDALFRDPYAVLAAIADEAKGTTSLIDTGSAAGLGATGEVDRTGSETYRDPFDPVAWDPSPQPVAPELETPASEPEPFAPEAAPAGPGPRDDAEPSAEVAAAELTATETKPEPVVERHAAKPSPSPMDGNSGDAGTVDVRPAAAADAESETDVEAEAASLRAQLARALEQESASERMPNVDVSSTNDGVLISLADEIDFGMFAIGSAEPRPETIAAMEKIAGVLETLPGEIIIRGHTDGRPFRSETYDNWRLSTARAHMAYHMLVRGGLEQTRVQQIEGHADRDLKFPDDPEAAENRRIDILVREEQS